MLFCLFRLDSPYADNWDIHGRFYLAGEIDKTTWLVDQWRLGECNGMCHIAGGTDIDGIGPGFGRGLLASLAEEPPFPDSRKKYSAIRRPQEIPAGASA